MENLNLSDKEFAPGIYEIESDVCADQLFQIAEQHNFKLIHIDGTEISNKKIFLQKFAELANFPEYFGHNWDAFWECIVDLEWLPASGYIILYENPEIFIASEFSEWKTALDILLKAVDFWKSMEVPFYVFLKGKIKNR